MRVTIRIVGRKSGGETWLEDACNMYLTRLKPSGLEIITEWHKQDAALIKSVQQDHDKQLPIILLDPTGNSYTSEKLASEFYRLLELGGSRVVFVIGGGSYLSKYCFKRNADK
jgi:23S rRNA pseudoU1915 N3-methylase RlmH